MYLIGLQEDTETQDEEEEEKEEEKVDENDQLSDKDRIELLIRENGDYSTMNFTMQGITTDDMKIIGDALRNNKVREPIFDLR
jgi:hypothetical protein